MKLQNNKTPRIFLLRNFIVQKSSENCWLSPKNILSYKEGFKVFFTSFVSSCFDSRYYELISKYTDVYPLCCRQFYNQCSKCLEQDKSNQKIYSKILNKYFILNYFYKLVRLYTTFKQVFNCDAWCQIKM